MCYRVIERYSICRCLYCDYDINACAAYGQRGHAVRERTVLVGYVCSEHSDRQLKLDSDAGKKSKEASSEVDIPKNNQAFGHPTTFTSMGPGTITPSEAYSLTPAEKGESAKKWQHMEQSTNADGGATDVHVPSNSKGSRSSVRKRNLNKNKQAILQKIQDSKNTQLQLHQNSKSSKEVEATGGDSQGILLATDESQLAKSTDNIHFGGDLEQQLLPVDPDFDSGEVELEEHKVSSVDNAFISDDPLKELKEALLAITIDKSQPPSPLDESCSDELLLADAPTRTNTLDPRTIAPSENRLSGDERSKIGTTHIGAHAVDSRVAAAKHEDSLPPLGQTGLTSSTGEHIPDLLIDFSKWPSPAQPGFKRETSARLMTTSLTSAKGLQEVRKAIHDYERFKQQTGIPIGAITCLSTNNQEWQPVIPNNRNLVEAFNRWTQYGLGLESPQGKDISDHNHPVQLCENEPVAVATHDLASDPTTIDALDIGLEGAMAPARHPKQ